MARDANPDKSHADRDADPTRDERIRQAIASDPRYKPAAFDFIAHAVPAIAAEKAMADKKNRRRHISGKELCMGLRQMLIRKYGRMAIDVLNAWHISQTIDFGEIVYDLVNAGVLSVSAEDSRDDFVNVFDFGDAFVKSMAATSPGRPMPIIFDMREDEKEAEKTPRKKK